MKIGTETYNHCIRCCRTLPNPSLPGAICGACIAKEILQKQKENTDPTNSDPSPSL